MANTAHYHWRIRGVQTWGGTTVALTELNFLCSPDLNSTSSTNVSSLPTTGGATAPIDGNPATTATWPTNESFWISRSYGSPVQMLGIRISGPERETFPSTFSLERKDYSSDWTVEKVFLGVQWPGPNVAADFSVSSGPGPVRLLGKFGHLTAATSSLPDLLPVPLGKCIGRVRGTITVKGVPASRRVRLVREKDGLTVREVWSDPTTGAYAFNRVDELQTYTVLAYDHTNTWPAEVAGGRNLENGGVVLMP